MKEVFEIITPSGGIIIELLRAEQNNRWMDGCTPSCGEKTKRLFFSADTQIKNPHLQNVHQVGEDHLVGRSSRRTLCEPEDEPLFSHLLISRHVAGNGHLCSQDMLQMVHCSKIQSTWVHFNQPASHAP